MFEGYVTGLVLQYGKKFIKDLPDLKLSVWGGDVELRNLQIRHDVVEQLMPGCGIIVTEGVVRDLRLHIPWTSLTSAPIEIHLNTLELDAIYDPEAALAATAARDRKPVTPQEEGEEPLVQERAGSESEGGWGAWVITKVRNNVSITVEKLLVRLRFQGFLITLRMDLLDCHSVNYLWERAVVEPGDTSFLRKLCLVEGVTFTVEPCDDEGIVTNKPAPVMSKVDLEARIAFLADRPRAGLPESRIDVLCTSHLAVTIGDEQLAVLFRLLRVFKSRKKRRKTLKAVATRRKPLATAQSAPVVMQDADSKPSQKGWMSWMWSAVAEDTPAEGYEHFEVRQPSVTALSFYVFHCSLNLTTESGNLMSMVLRHGGVEILTGDVDREGPTFAFGCEQVRIEEGSTGRVMLEAKSSRTNATNGVFFDSTPSLPFSLYDKRQGVAFAVDVTDVVTRRQLIDHEVAFNRYEEGQEVLSIAAQQKDKWICCDAVFVAFYSGVPEEDSGEKMATPSTLRLSFSPKTCLLSFPTIFDVISFIRHGVSGKSMKMAALEAERQPVKVASPEVPRGAVATDDVPSSYLEELRQFWAHSPPTELTLSIAPCEVHVPVFEPAGKNRGNVGLSPSLRHGSVTLAFLDHQGITFSNKASFPTAEVLHGHAFESAHQQFSQNVFSLHFQSMSIGIIHRGSSISSQALRRTLTLRPTTCSVAFGKSVLRSSPASSLSVTALPLFLSCHRLELALLLSCIPAAVVSHNWTEAALEFIHAQNSAPDAPKPTVEAEDEIVLQLKSLEFGMTSLRDHRNVTLSIGTGTVSCGSRGSDREIPPIFNLADLPDAEFCLSATLPKGAATSQPLEVELTIRDCELFVVPALISQWMLSTEHAEGPSPSQPVGGEASQEDAPTMVSDPTAPLQRLFDSLKTMRRAAVRVDIQKVLVRSSPTTDSTKAFCVFLPELTVKSSGKGDKRSWSLVLTRLQVFCEEVSIETTEVAHHRILKALTVNGSLASERLSQLAVKVDILPLAGAVTLEEAQELALLFHKFQELSAKPSNPAVDRSQRTHESSLSSDEFMRWVDANKLDITVTGRLQELELRAVAHTLLVSDVRLDVRIGGKVTGTAASCSASIVGVSLLRDSTEPIDDALSLFGNSILLCNSPARSAVAEPFARLVYELRRDKNSTAPLMHSINVSIDSVQIFPWWPSLLSVARFLGFSTAALANGNSGIRRTRASTGQAPQSSSSLQPSSPYHLSFSLKIGEVVLAIPSLLDETLAGVVLTRIPGCSAQADVLMSDPLVVRTLSACLDGGMLYIGQLAMAEAKAGDKIPLPGTAADLPQWLQPQLANPVRVRVSAAQSLEAEGSLPFLRTPPKEQADNSLQICVSMSPVSVRMQKTNLGALLASLLCAAKCSTAIRKLLSGSTGARHAGYTNLPAAPPRTGQAGIVLVLVVPDVEVQLVGRAQEGGGRAMLLSRVINLHVTSNLSTGELDGFVEDIYVKSVNNDRLSEILGRKASNRQVDARSRHFVTVSTDGKSVILALAPIFVSLDAALFMEHLDLVSVPAWNTEVLLAYDNDIKRKQKMIRQAAGAVTGHVRRPSDSAPLSFAQAKKKAQKGSGRVYKLLLPECQVVAAITLAPGMSKTSNAVLSAVTQEIFVYYAQGQEHCSLSMGAVDVSVSDSLEQHCPVLQPPMACHLSITEELHAVTSALPKRALSASVSIPVINSVISLGQVRALVDLASAFQEALSPVTAGGAAKSRTGGHRRAASLPTGPIQEELLLSSGELLREGFSIGSERDQRPFVNQITLSGERDEEDAIHSVPWMSWRYPEPRSVRIIAVRPFPSVEDSQEPVTFQLQYFDSMTLSMSVLCSFQVDLQAGQVLKCSVAASGSDATVSDGVATLTGPAMMVSADEWKLVAFSLPCSPAVFPLACQVRSVFLPEFSFAVRSSLQVQTARLSIVNHFTSVGSRTSAQVVGGAESLFAVTATDAQLSFIKWRDSRMKFGVKGDIGVEFVEGTFLTTHPVLEPTSFFLLLERDVRQTAVSLHSNKDAALMVTKSFVDLAASTVTELTSIVSDMKHPNQARSRRLARSCSASFVAVNSTNVAVELCQSDGKVVLGRPVRIEAYSSEVVSFQAVWQPSFSIRVAPPGEQALPWSGSVSPFVAGWDCLPLPCPGGETDCWLYVQEDNDGRARVEVMGNLILESHLSQEILVKPMAIAGEDDAVVVVLSIGEGPKGLLLFPGQMDMASQLQVKATVCHDSQWRSIELGSNTSTALAVLGVAHEGPGEHSVPILVSLDASLVNTVYFTPLVKLSNSCGLPLICEVSSGPAVESERADSGLRLPIGGGTPSEPSPATELIIGDAWHGPPCLAFRHLDGNRWTAVDDLLSDDNISRYMTLVKDLLVARSRAEAQGTLGDKLATNDRQESLTILQQRSVRLFLPSSQGEEGVVALQLKLSLCVDVDAAQLPPPLQVVVSLPYRITNLTDLPIYAMEASESGNLRCVEANASQMLQWSTYGTEGLHTSCLPPFTPLRLQLGVAPSSQPASPATPSRAGDLYSRLRRSITWADVVLELKGSRKTTRLLVRDEDAGISVPLTVQVLRHSRSTELVVTASHVVTNRTTMPLLLQVTPQGIVRLEPGATKDIAGPWSSPTATTRVALEYSTAPAAPSTGLPVPEPETQCSQWSREFRMGYVGPKEEAVARIHVVQGPEGMRTGHLLTFGVRVKDGRQHTVFYVDQQPPLRIENRCKHVTVRCTPLGSHSPLESAAFAVAPAQSSDFAHPAECIVGNNTEHLRRGILLQWRFFDASGTELSDKPIVVDTTEEGTAHVPLGDSVVFVSNAHAGNTVLLVLTDKGAVVDDKGEAEKRAVTSSFSFSFHGLSVCLVEERRPSAGSRESPFDTADMWQELALLSLDRCLGKLSRKEMRAAFSDVPMVVNTLHFSVGDLQLDNMLRYCEFPVVCLPVKQKSSHPAVDIVAALATVEGSTFLQCFSAQLASLDLRMEDAFLYSVQRGVAGLISPGGGQARSEDWTSLTKAPPLPSHLLAEVERPAFYIRSLRVARLDLRLSLRVNVGIFLSLDHSPVELDAFSISREAWQPRPLAKHLTQVYVYDMVFRAPTILGSLELMGNPTNLIRDYAAAVQELIQRPLEGAMHGPSTFFHGCVSGVSGFLVHSSRGTLTSLSGMTSSVARNLDKLSLDSDHASYRQLERMHQDEQATSSVVRGIKGFSYGVVSGISGVVSQPVTGAYQKGVSGLFAGIGRGLLGAVTKPVGGALELISYTSQGVLHTVASPVRRRRPVRPLLQLPRLPDTQPALHCYAVQWAAALVVSGRLHGTPLFSCCGTQEAKGVRQACLLVATTSTLYVIQRRGLAHLLSLDSLPGPPLGVGSLALRDVVCVRQHKDPVQVLLEAVSPENGRITLLLRVEQQLCRRFLIALVSALSRTS